MNSKLQQEYDEKGFCIARGAIDAGLAAETVEHVQWLVKKHPDTRPERLHHNLLVNDPFMHRLVCDDRLVDLAAEFIGPNVAMFGAHYIAKKPETGQAVRWHQDGSYWPLEPMEVTTLWVAGNDSTVENGCMRVVPGSHTRQLLKASEMVELDPDKYVLGVGMRPDQIDEADAVDVVLNAGDISIHHPNIIHGSNSNTSDQWRVGLTLRYIPTSTRVTRQAHPSILCRGAAIPEVGNLYA
ncbi:MAG: phytanoyl-CoA dioxygenase family protein, partial [Candidatus Latescibacteria bacterium]|nr:phytanoyl-CoA dioxygenase family protein [Candidatus Latescibacterota bacterium]